MASVLSLQLEKSITYRGDTSETFTNRYYFKTGPPAVTDTDLWKQYLDALWNHEKLIFPPGIHLVAGHGWNDDSEDAHRVFSHDYAADGPNPGTYVQVGTELGIAGDQACVVEWKTDIKSSRGKPIFLRKYFHGGFCDSNFPDNVGVTYLAALQHFANEMAFTTFLGGLRSRAHDLNVASAIAYPYVTTRTLKHRGRRGGPKAQATRASFAETSALA